MLVHSNQGNIASSETREKIGGENTSSVPVLPFLKKAAPKDQEQSGRGGQNPPSLSHHQNPKNTQPDHHLSALLFPSLYTVLF
jgi:hypothetical protein